MKDYQRTEPNVVIVIVRPVVVDVGKTTIVGITTDQTVVILE